MNTPNTSDTQTDLSRVLAKIAEIAEKSATGDYIYRGESETHDKVSSNLYREYEADIEAENFDIAVVQEEILREAREYTTYKMDDSEILAELQHHGGKTNLIDFTTDYLVALFFACDGNSDKPGRVILLQNQSGDYEVVKPPRTIKRAGVQKSIFVQTPKGVVDPDIVVWIPAALKGTCWTISENTTTSQPKLSTTTSKDSLQTGAVIRARIRSFIKVSPVKIVGIQ
ncbi:MAG: FRG domain-containing protein [Candidatus Poribacteria bacterium]|nr:FRG domain-containing protein [Candidatus Poribacteria bacterium]